ncbi:MAG: hypothetical protein KIS85_01035 [Anaerolineales bacterium]|nr:hypothetical protein [Anaerolineales bacterium]
MNVRNLFIGLGKAVFYWGFVQIILIGAAYFGAIPAGYHSMSGQIMTIALLLMLVLSVAGKMGPRIIGLSLLAFALLGAQRLLVHDQQPLIGALHPIFGIGVMFLGLSLSKRAAQLPK